MSSIGSACDERITDKEVDGKTDRLLKFSFPPVTALGSRTHLITITWSLALAISGSSSFAFELH